MGRLAEKSKQTCQTKGCEFLITTALTVIRFRAFKTRVISSFFSHKSVFSLEIVALK